MDDRNRPRPLYLMKVQFVVKIDALVRRVGCSSNDAWTPRWGRKKVLLVTSRLTIGRSLLVKQRLDY